MPITLLCVSLRPRAMALGLKLYLSTIACTRARVSCRTPAVLGRMRETVAVETPPLWRYRKL
jgi:hypothetical protein